MIQELSYRKQIVRQLELYLQWRTNRKSYMVYQIFFQWLSTIPDQVFNVTLYFDAEYLING